MNALRVNLLKKSEQRYQGAVSRRFLAVSLVVAPVLIIAVLSGIKLVQYAGVQSELKSSRLLWDSLEPRLELFKDENRGLSANRTMLDLFEGWKNSQGSFVQLLDDIQSTVPDDIQFTRLSVRGLPTATVYAATNDMAIAYELVIEGISTGERAENEVINLRRELLECEQIGSTFSSLKLAALRKSSRGASQNSREFRLEGTTTEGGAQ
jgi:hypothetical protein